MPMEPRQTIGELLQTVAEKRARHPAIVDEAGSLTWAKFVERIRSTAHALASIGLKQGERVALLLPPSRRYLETDYGIMAGGFVRVPIDPRSPLDDVAALIRSSGARALATTPDRASQARRLFPELQFALSVGGNAAGAQDFDMLVDAARDVPFPEFDPDALATINYSGGTTGAPKGITLSHVNLTTVLAHASRAFEITQSAVFLNVRPLWPIAQLVTMAHLAAGARVVLESGFDPTRLADQIAASRATRTSLVPTQLFRLLDRLTPDDPRLARLEAIYIGGSRLAPDVFRRALTLIGPKIGVLYGMTEAPISSYLTPRLAASLEEARSSVGFAVPGCEIRISDGTGSFAEPRAVGEVIIRGSHVMKGYWRDEEATRSALRDGWLHTGDLGTLAEDGRLEIVGRIKDVIRSGAQSIVPAEVEDVLFSHPAVEDVAVLGLPDEEWGEIVAAFVVRKARIEITGQDLDEFCRSRLAGFKRPRAFRFVSRIPRSHYGKPQRAVLLDEASNEQSC